MIQDITKFKFFIVLSSIFSEKIEREIILQKSVKKY